VTSKTLSPTITQQSSSVACLATSAGVIPEDFLVSVLDPEDSVLEAVYPEEDVYIKLTFPPFWISKRLVVVYSNK